MRPVGNLTAFESMYLDENHIFYLVIKVKKTQKF